MLTVTVENVAEAVVLRCQGNIVRGDETAILCSAAQQESRNLILDLTQVDAIDTAGIGALVALQGAGVYLKLMNPTEPVREVLKVAKLDSIFEICASQASPVTPAPMQAGIPDNTPERIHVPLV
jgi:anti-anti-sigma factor